MYKYIKQEILQFKYLLPYLLLIIVPVLRKTIFNRARDMDAYNQVDGSAGVAIVFTLITLGLVVPKWKQLTPLRKPTMSFINYYLFAIVSIAWAGLNFIPIVGYKAIEVIAHVLLTVFIMSKMISARQAFDFVMVQLFLLNVMYLAWNHEHDNAFPILGMSEFFMALGVIRYNIEKKKNMVPHLIVGLATVILSTSTATWMSFIIGLFFFYSTSVHGINIVRAIIVGAFFYTAYMMFEDTIQSIVFGHKTQEMIESGSGRRELWTAYIQGWLESPLFGHGFVIGEKGAAAAHYIHFATNTAHNMMISVLVNTGIIGMIIWLNFIWKLSKKCYDMSLRKNSFALIMFPVIIAMFINANSFPIIGSEWSPVSPPIYAMIVFIFTFMPMAMRDERYIAK